MADKKKPFSTGLLHLFSMICWEKALQKRRGMGTHTFPITPQFHDPMTVEAIAWLVRFLKQIWEMYAFPVGEILLIYDHHIYMY